MNAIVESSLLLFVLLNPFILWVYLQEMLQPLPSRTVWSILARGAAIAAVVFVVFAWTGDAIFTGVLQVRFASFVLFGGILFLVIGVRFIVLGSRAKQELVGGAPEHVAGAIAMPFLIGPGTVSASVLAGKRAGPVPATIAIVLALAVTVIVVMLIRALHRRVADHVAPFIDRYTAIVGRVSALVIGTIAVDMILRGIDMWRGTT